MICPPAKRSLCPVNFSARSLWNLVWRRQNLWADSMYIRIAAVKPLTPTPRSHNYPQRNWAELQAVLWQKYGMRKTNCTSSLSFQKQPTKRETQTLFICCLTFIRLLHLCTGSEKSRSPLKKSVSVIIYISCLTREILMKKRKPSVCMIIFTMLSLVSCSFSEADPHLEYPCPAWECSRMKFWIN